ncbi:MAG: flippase [Bacteroidota bacterium]
MSERKLIRDITSVLGSNLVTLAIGFITGVILSRVLGPEGRGAYAAVLIIPGLFASFALLGTRQSAIYFVGKKLFEDEKIVASILVSLFLSTLIGGSLSLIFYLYSDKIIYEPLLITLAILIIPTRLLIIYAGGFFLGKEKYKISNLLKILPAFLNLVFICLFLLVLKLDVAGALMAMLAGNLLIDIFALKKISKVCPIKFRLFPEVQKKMILMGMLYAISVFILQLNYRIDILLLERMSTIEQIGFYTLAVGLGQLLWQIPSAMGTVVRTRTANAEDQSTLNNSMDQVLRISLITGLCGTVAIYFLTPYFLPLIYGENFTDSVPMVQAILPGMFLMILFKICNNRIAGMGKPLVTLFAFIPALILNIILNFLWIPEYGGMGAAWASCASYSLGGIVILAAYSVITRHPVYKIFRFNSSDFSLIFKMLTLRGWKKA